MKASDRKNLDWKALAEEFNNMVKDTTPETAVRVEVCKGMEGEDYCIDIYPAETNKSNCFYCNEELVDFSRCKGLSCWVDVIDGFVRAHIH